jgi:hypothetical protein
MICQHDGCTNDGEARKAEAFRREGRIARRADNNAVLPGTDDRMA